MSHEDRILEEGVIVINEPEMKMEAGTAGVDWGAGREVSCDPWMRTENQQEYKVATDTRRVNRWVTADQWRYQLGDKRLPRVITFYASSKSYSCVVYDFSYEICFHLWTEISKLDVLDWTLI